jgi:hypothetical protein
LDDLPAQIFVSEPGSFAEYTMRYRLPRILQDVRDQNAYPAEIQANLAALQLEMSQGQVQALAEDSPDTAFWLQAWHPWQGCTWQQLPWLFAETYFYRRILEAVSYFYPGPWHGHDPFTIAKQQGLVEGITRLTTLLHTAPDAGSPRDAFWFWLYSSLWSNRADFSNLVSLANANVLSGGGNDYLLVDDSLQVWNTLQSGRIERLDIVCDNAGPELLTDLAFADQLFLQRLVEKIVLHVKPQPYYVSDAMIEDVIRSIHSLQANADGIVSSLGNRLQNELRNNHLYCSAHSFWASCLTLFQMPTDLVVDMSQADLAIFKGDVNYRRLLDDRHWPSTTPLDEVPNQVPNDYVALRTVKSELICGLASGQSEQMVQRDPEWLINGRWGLVQYVARPRN